MKSTIEHPGDAAGAPKANAFAANTTHALRGDYTRIASDYTVEQPFKAYTDEEHARWRYLYDRQSSLLPGYAAKEFIDGLKDLDAGGAIPRLDAASEVLDAATRWRLVAVPGLIPDDVFFDHLANRRFPVSWWIRRADELDYLVEPDIFHDFFGHVPLLSNRTFADYMQEYGKGGLRALSLGGEKMLARLYWYMMEFGLIRTSEGLRAFGAGMLSSKDETIYSVESPRPHRVAFDLERVLSTAYMVDDFQKTYFVVESFDELIAATAVDFAPIYARLKESPPIDPATLLPCDRVVSRGAIGEA